MNYATMCQMHEGDKIVTSQLKNEENYTSFGLNMGNSAVLKSSLL